MPRPLVAEIATAWQLGKPIIAVAPCGGWAEKLAGKRVDERRKDRVWRVESAEQAVTRALEIVQGR